MPAQPILAEDRVSLYAVVEGIDFDLIERCECSYLLVIDGLNVCTECGTCYGIVMGWATDKDLFRGTRRRRPRRVR